jgi:O-antigen/teichoic acid export membrane protein
LKWRKKSPNDSNAYICSQKNTSHKEEKFSTIIGWLSMAIIRFYPAYGRDGKLNEFWANVVKLTIISIVVVSFISIVILLIAKSHFSARLYSLMWIGILVFILSSIFEVLQHFLRVERQVSWYSGFTIWKSITAIGFGLLLVIVFHFGVDGLLWGTITGFAIVLPFLWKKTVRQVSFDLDNISIPLTLEMAKYGFPLVVGNLAAWILSLSDRYILEFFRGSQEVGIYSASYNISAHSIMLLASLFMLASGPISIHIWEKEGVEKSKEFVSKLTRYYLIICIPAVVGLSVLAKPIIDILTGEGYYMGYRIVPFVAFGVLFLGLEWIFQTGLRYFKKTQFTMLCITIAGLLNLGLNFLLVPQYGYTAAAITTLISYALLLFLMVVVSRRYFIWKFPFETLAKVTCASAIMGTVVYPISNSLTTSVLINLILGIFIGIVVYTVMLFVLREPNTQEVQVLQATKTKIFKKLKW